MSYEQKMAFNKRRDFMKFIGAAGLSLPVLQASTLGAGMLLARQAEAAPVAQRRVIFVYVPDGTPKGAASSFTPTDNLTMNTCTTPFEAYKQQCIFFKDVVVSGGGGHGNSQRVLGAFEPGVKGTIDLALQGTVGATSPVAALRLGLRTGGKDSISSAGYTTQAMQDNPQAAFEATFGSVGQNVTSVATTRELKALEINQAALAQIKTKLGTYELQRLQEHEASIAKLRADITAAGTGGGGTGACNTGGFNPGALATTAADSNFTNLWALQTENVVLAMQCNITRIATLQMGTHQGEFSVTGIDTQLHGDAVHGTISRHYFYRTYFSERIAYLIRRLSEVNDPLGGKLIDSTLILQVTDMGDGNAHAANDAPYMMAGGGTAVQRGKVLSVPSNMMLLDSVAQYMGVYGTIPKYSAGPAAGILV